MGCLIRQAIIGDEIRTVTMRAINEHGGLKCVAFLIGKTYANIWNDFNRNQHGLGIDTIIQLYHVGIVEPLQYVADKCDCNLTPKASHAKDEHSILEEAGHLETKSATLINHVIEGLRDGSLDEKEQRQIRRDYFATQRELWEIGQRLEKEAA